jgi:hypothetical protein
MKDDRVTVGEAIDYLQNGAVFLKYGKRGNPHARHIYLEGESLFWSDSAMMGDLKKGNKK